MAGHTKGAGATEPPVVDAESFRAAMGHLAMPVALVAAQHGAVQDAFTTTTVCSAGVDPPTLIVCINRHSTLGELIERTRSFSVNVLTDEQAAIGRLFSVPRRDSDGRFGAGTWRTGLTGAPLLDDALASFDCRMVQDLDSGPNRIVLGRVVSIGFGEKQPLLYRGGFFRRLAVS
jgi:flavin reductase (DIM6/NTAB) family NADH-FMN oxidoreductase RutF